MNLAYIPSPSEGVWHLGPLPLRAYALAIIVGIVVAIWVGERRFVARGGRPGTVSDVAVWAIPFGLVGARIYHVATNPEFYFGEGKEPIQALYVWEGGLGIWGAIAFGALGAYLGCRYSGVKFTSYVDAVAPGIVLAQAIGRWGNYFNQELFGKPTDRPWGLEIDPLNRPVGYEQYSTFHPTFLYESLWCIGVAIVLVVVDRRRGLGRGRVFALYVALYTAGRAWIEDLRIDDAHEFGPFRLNVWVAIGVFVVAVAYFVIVGRRRPGREKSVLRGVSDDEADRAEATKELEPAVATAASADRDGAEGQGAAAAGAGAAAGDGSTDTDAKDASEGAASANGGDKGADAQDADTQSAGDTDDAAETKAVGHNAPSDAEGASDESASTTEAASTIEAASTSEAASTTEAAGPDRSDAANGDDSSADKP
jgi:prolipoprotein diacylglyceryl transferase